MHSRLNKRNEKRDVDEMCFASKLNQNLTHPLPGLEKLTSHIQLAPTAVGVSSSGHGAIPESNLQLPHDVIETTAFAGIASHKAIVSRRKSWRVGGSTCAWR